jgi:hypothetical protein
MPGRALLSCQKKKINRDWIREHLGKAVQAYRQELLKEPKEHCGLRVIAEYHGLKKDMLA